MKEGRQSDAKYKRLSIQRKTCAEVDRKIYGAICDRGSGINEHGKIMTTKFNENSSGSKHKPDSMI